MTLHLGAGERKILKWLYERDRWHLTQRILNTLVPDDYANSPKEWGGRKLRRLQEKQLVRGRHVGHKNTKVWTITTKGREVVEKRGLVED